MNVVSPAKTGVSSSTNTSSFAVLLEQDGILKLLVAIRGSAIPKRKKTALRDLVLEFSQIDESSKLKAQAKTEVLEMLTQYPEDFEPLVKVLGGIAPEPVTVKSVQKSSPFGSTRPTPLFVSQGVRKVNVVVTSVPTSEPPSVPTSTPPSPEVAQEPVKETVSEEQQQLAAVTQTPEPVQVETEVPVPEPVQAPEPVVEATTVPPSVSTVDPLVRIKEIKRLVHKKVGNPINLIQQNNEIGREYMTALLEAMKKVSGGAPGELEETMVRLELAYKAIEVFADSGVVPPTKAVQPKTADTPDKKSTEKEVVKTTPPATETEIPVPESKGRAPLPVAKSELSQSSVTPPPPLPPKPRVAEQVVTPEPSIKKLSVQSDSVAPAEKQDDVPTPQPVVPEVPVPPKAVPDPEPEIVKSEQKVTVPVAPVEKIQEDKPTTQRAVPIEVASQKKTPEAPKENKEEASKIKEAAHSAKLPEKKKTPFLHSLADSLIHNEEKLEKIDGEKKETGDTSKVKAPEIKKAPEKPVDELHTNDINAGLEQLLSEWSLFKKSGFFGTGVHGTAHPLYKQISGLSMAAIVSGRFEGSSPQIKQSITDYMNGWRYEQGIIHQMNEQFEHYLRRVIQHILTEQAKKKTAEVSSAPVA